jgi:fumarate reductase flavoprotein subunit
MKIIHSDVLVIGGGLAGLRTAIGARRRGLEVTILSLVPPKRSHSAAAQGGMQASLANSVKGYGDNEDVHFADTVRGSDWGADQAVVRLFTHMAPKAVRELAHWGVPWNRVEAGSHTAIINGQKVKLTEHPDAHGLITARNFGGTARWRTSYVADGTGHSMLYAVSDQAIAANIPVHERMEAVALIHREGRCYGAIVRNLINGELLAYTAGATCIATGGFGRIYRVSTNAIINEGMGAAIALETGVATLGNMEAVQFHPTGIFPAGILVTEGCRGDGGLLLDGNGHRFMPDYEPEQAELASRDVVSRHMEYHIRQGFGAKTRFGEHLWLDIRQLGADHINNKLREVKEICGYFLGIDPLHDLIPVRPAQHYSMGGVRTDVHGHSPQLQGLFACGEAACWDMHGFNRLGGNSVAEAVVAGMIVGETIADYCAANPVQIDTALVHACGQRQQAYLQQLLERKGPESPAALLKAMQNLMTDQVGIYRDGPALAAAVQQLQALLARTEHMGLRSSAPGANPELVLAYRLPRMLKLALCVAMGARDRTESRGAHCRTDYPQRDDSRWLNRTLARWPEGAPAPQLSYEPLNVLDMELPPGWRGYGSKDYVQHPDAARRQQEVAALNAAYPERFARQQALLPFTHLLPPRYRTRNGRFQEVPVADVTVLSAPDPVSTPDPVSHPPAADPLAAGSSRHD